MYFYIGTIQKPKPIDKIQIDAYSKTESIYARYTEAEKLYPTINRMIK